MALFTDTFTNTAGTGLVAHGWSVSGADALNIATGGATLASNGGTSATWTIFSPPTQPSGADHYVQAVCSLGATTWAPLGVRVNATNKTGYFARRGPTAIQLYRGNAGTLTLLGSFTGGSSTGVIKLVATGTTLEVFNDGVSVIGPLTDATYSDVGVGILTRGGSALTGAALDNWESSETASASVGAAAGSGTVSGTGAAVQTGAGSTAGAASASGVGAAVQAGSGSSAGVATVSGTGAVGASGSTGTSAGTSAASGSGAAIAAGAGAAAGAGQVSGVGAVVQISDYRPATVGRPAPAASTRRAATARARPRAVSGRY